jgi:hypothetical protein
MSQHINLFRRIPTAVATLALAAASLLAMAANSSAGAAVTSAASAPPVYCTPGAFGWDKDAPCLYN